MAHNVTLAAATANTIADAVAALCDGGTVKPQTCCHVSRRMTRSIVGRLTPNSRARAR